MKNNVLVAVVAAAIWGGAASARQIPNPPPSGIVVHLFGPDSITSNILPQAAPAPSGSAPAAAGAPSSQPAAAQAAAPYPEPSLHDVLHQMFITGDPDAKPGAALARGRRGNN